MKKKVFTVVALAIATVFACIGLIGCAGGKSLTVGQEYEESIGSGTKVVDAKINDKTATLYMNAKVYSFKVEEKGIYTISVTGSSVASGDLSGIFDDLTKVKTVAFGGILLKSEDAKGFSASVVLNAMKAGSDENNEDVKKFSEYAKKSVKTGIGIGVAAGYSLEPDTYTFYVSSTSSEDVSQDYKIKITKA